MLPIPPSDDVIREIRRRVNILTVIGENVVLIESAGTHLGHCPFHLDVNLTLSVDAVSQTYSCSECGAAGDVIAYVMQRKKLSLNEAVNELSG